MWSLDPEVLSTPHEGMEETPPEDEEPTPE